MIRAGPEVADADLRLVAEGRSGKGVDGSLFIRQLDVRLSGLLIISNTVAGLKPCRRATRGLCYDDW